MLACQLFVIEQMPIGTSGVTSADGTRRLGVCPPGTCCRRFRELPWKTLRVLGGREGYATLLNSDMKREQDHLARFLGLTVVTRNVRLEPTGVPVLDPSGTT